MYVAMGPSERASAAVDKKPVVKVGYYGSRKSAKLIRYYFKKELGVFRVEGEFHSSFLRNHQVADEQDLVDVARAFYPQHLRFVEMDWQKLEQYLRKKHGKDAGKAILRRAQGRAASIQRVTRYLRRKDVTNVHRFYVPLAINKQVRRALEEWAVQFEHDRQKARKR